MLLALISFACESNVLSIETTTTDVCNSDSREAGFFFKMRNINTWVVVFEAARIADKCLLARRLDR